MRKDLDNKFLDYINNNDITNVYLSIQEGCKAELIHYIHNKALYLNEELEKEIIDHASEMIYYRVVYGYKIGENKGKRLIPKSLGAYCHTVVLNEYRRYVKKYLDEKDYLDKIKEELNEYKRI